MDQAAEWPIPIIATQDVACGVRVWSTAGKTRATVVVKATFFLVRGGPMRLVNPAPILLGDQHHEGSVDRSVLAPADVAPYLPRAEVIFSGHAYAPTPSPFVPVRLAIVGSRPLVDKTLHVFGERMWVDGEQMTAPVPFTRIPIRYERAFGGHDGDDNPVGMAKGPGMPVHNIIDPSDPDAPAGFGAIAPHWPSRRRLLRNLDPAVALGPEPALPDTFAWTFFHTAPADQRCSFFEGNEWLVLEGLHPEHPRFESQLPGAQARARLYSLESTSHREVSLTADTLWIDGDRSMGCLLWRGNFEVEADTLSNVQLFAGLELPGRAIPWPDVQPARASSIAAAEAAPADATMASIGGKPIAVAMPQHAGRGTAQYGGQPAMPLATPATPEAAPAGSMLAALANDAPQGEPPTALRDGPPAGADLRYNQGQTLASPGVMAQAAVAAAEQINANRQRAAAAPQPPIAIGAVPTAEGAPPSAPIEVDPNWLEPARANMPTSLASPSEIPASGGSTMTSPPSELQALIRQTRQDDAAPKTVAQPSFDDSPTVAPDTGDLERILEEADQQARADGEEAAAHEKAVPIGARPEPNQPRPQKTTIRGLGRSPSGSMPAVIEPPPATARVTTSHLMQGEEVATAQLPVPEMLLKLAAQPASQRVAAGQGDTTLRVEAPAIAPPSIPLPPISQQPPRIEERPPSVDLDEDDTGRPTLTGMEAPPVSQAQAQPQVHKGETRMEVERRIREGDALDGLDFSDLDLSGFDFSGKKLTNSRFDRANLRKCRLCGADLTGASLEGADLGETDLDDAVLERTNLVSAKLTGATLRRTFLTDANLTTADARRAVLDQASGQRTIFARTRLDGASAVGARLDSADFTEAQIDGASFENALLPELKAYEVSAEDTSFVRASLQNARFDGGVLGRARFDGASAEDSMWDRAVLDGSSFESAKLCGGSFTKASLRGCNLNHADLGEARFNRANLNGASFIGVDLGSLTLDGADMTGVVTG